ncbi:MAG: tetratricopeptide repeat protein [Alphaproteobacteria bacterium]|nr:tetratricopeptide repeat protein [Alphaproteobacteria bacterium]
MRKAGKRIRITAQLVEAAAGNHVWAERYDRDLEDIFAVQDEVTERIVWALAGKVAFAEISRSKVRRQEHLDAYDLMLRGIEAFHRFTRENSAEAVRFLEQAVAADPASGRAHAWLAQAYGFQAGFESDPSRDDLAYQAATRALDLGDSDGLAEATLAAHQWFLGEFDSAETYMERAVTLGPNNPYILSWQGFMRLWQGRSEEARAIGERLRRLDPLDPSWVHEFLAFANYLLGDYTASLEFFRKWNKMEPYRGFANLAACLAQLGRISEAQAAWRKCLDYRPGFTVEDYKRGSMYRRQEDLDHWLDGLRKAGLIG